MKAPILSLAVVACAAAGAWAAQPTSNNFYPAETVKPYTSFLGFDRDKQEMQDLQTRLQNSGTNWHCIGDAQHLRCPLSGDTGANGSNVYFRGPHIGDSGATVSEFHVTLLVDDAPTLSQLQPEIRAIAFLGQDWSSIMFALGKPTNEYDDGSTVQHLYCASRELPAKAGEPNVARLYIMYINVSHSLNVVTSVELATTDQFLPPLAKPSC
jgi:hypothetical protein